jgi:sec-independent protein translocase protein TatA
MQAFVVNVHVLATLFGVGQLFVIIAMTLLLLGRKRFPELAKGLHEGMREFRKATTEVRDKLEQKPFEAGESIGGIFSKPTAEALTPDNQVAELYDPAVFGEKQKAAEAAKNKMRKQFAFLRLGLKPAFSSVIIGLVLMICVWLAVHFFHQ